jgi:hypothetical protein
MVDGRVIDHGELGSPIYGILPFARPLRYTVGVMARERI